MFIISQSTIIISSLLKSLNLCPFTPDIFSKSFCSLAQLSIIFNTEQTSRHCSLPFAFNQSLFKTRQPCLQHWYYLPQGLSERLAHPQTGSSLKAGKGLCSIQFCISHCKQAQRQQNVNRQDIQRDLGLNPGCAIWAIYTISLSLIFLICNAYLKGLLWRLNEVRKCMSPYQDVAATVLISAQQIVPTIGIINICYMK